MSVGRISFLFDDFRLTLLSDGFEVVSLPGFTPRISEDAFDSRLDYLKALNLQFDRDALDRGVLASTNKFGLKFIQLGKTG